MKVLFTGPECSGKTTIAQWSSAEWNGTCVPEYARIHLNALNRPYEIDDLLVIANQQLKLESLAAGKNTPVFCDTSLLVIHIWMMEKFHVSLWEQGFHIEHLRSYDHIFLCNPDMPWEPDDLRENQMDRLRLLELYRKELHENEVKFHSLYGSLAHRQQTIREIVRLD